MLKRIVIDNFRCLVDFDLSVDAISLFLGPNGSGKSTVFDALRKIQAFVTGRDTAQALFKPADLTRWQEESIQKFGLEIEGNGGRYKYELIIRHDLTGMRKKVQVVKESLWFDNQPLLTGQQYTDDHALGERSAIASAHPGLIWFRERMKRFIIVQPVPPLIERVSCQQEALLSDRMENFTSWYRHIWTDQDKASQINEGLKEMFKDFDTFKLVDSETPQPVLQLHFSNGNNGHQPTEYRFHEMADGDRGIIALSTLIYYARQDDYTLCIDEPENFMALQDIQPWLLLLYDLCDEEELQALVITHHPQFINLFASHIGIWFDREDHHTPTQAKPLTNEDEGGIPMNVLVARDWIYDY